MAHIPSRSQGACLDPLPLCVSRHRHGGQRQHLERRSGCAGADDRRRPEEAGCLPAGQDCL